MNKKENLQDRAYAFSLRIIKFLNEHRNIPLSVRDQLLRSATSIGANLIEARGSGSKKEFARFFQISLKSANETEYWLRLISDGYGYKDNEILNSVGELSKMIAASLITMRNNDNSK